MIYRWKQQSKALGEDERGELKRLRKENKNLRMEKEILRKVKSHTELCAESNSKLKTPPRSAKTKSPQAKIKTEQPAWQLPPDYFKNLPPTHNAFIGKSHSDTIENVIAGIDLLRKIATQEPSGLMLGPDSCFGLLWYIQNLRNAMQFELDYGNQR